MKTLIPFVLTLFYNFYTMSFCRRYCIRHYMSKIEKEFLRSVESPSFSRTHTQMSRSFENLRQKQLEKKDNQYPEFLCPHTGTHNNIDSEVNFNKPTVKLWLKIWSTVKLWLLLNLLLLRKTLFPFRYLMEIIMYLPKV